MSKKSKIFTYGTGKRKIGHSKFDMSFSNTFSQGFGELNPVAVYETLPDDFWNVGSDGVTLLKPLAAPAFSDIKQHYYAFNVRNSAIWDHWNDFITNGTAFSDVYGSNASNQAADNPWKVPSINAGYLQDICKIGSGYGVLAHHEIVTLGGYGFTQVFNDLEVELTFTDSSWHDVTSLFLYVIETPEFLQSHDNPSELREMLRDTLVLVQAIYDSSVSGNYPYRFHFVFACNYTVYRRIHGLLANDNNVAPSIPQATTIGQTEFQSQQDLILNGTSFDFILFADDSCGKCKLSESPFVVERFSYSYQDAQVYKSFRYLPRFSDVPVTVAEQTIGSATYYSCRSTNSNFLGRCFVFSTGSARDFDGLWSLLDSRIVDPSTDVNGYFESIQTISNAVRPYFGVVAPISDQFCAQYGYAFDSVNFLTGFFNLPAPIYQTYDGTTTISPYNAARSLGFDGEGFSVYLSQNSLKLLDGFNFPVAALACRSYFFYRYQDFNALIPFANSKIWDKFFRNTVVSSPELDYSKTNGEILFDVSLRAFQSNTTFPTQDRLPEKYSDAGNPPSSWPLNSWVIPFESIPLNGMLNQGFSLQSTGTPSLVVSLSGHHNQLVIRSRADVFRLLTGFGLDHMVLDKMYHLFVDQVANSGVTFATFSELFTRNFYLPNYYNGLLHLKYQNFNKDYFTSAMLDPMSGANQVAIGSTVTENRLAESKQSWFERIAQQRSVKGFMEAIFGITPTLDDKEPRFLGSEHIPVNIGEVIQTSSSTPTSPQGQRVGIGGSRGGSSLVHGHVNEHGWLIILCSFTVESQYCQALEKQLIPVNSYMDYPTIDFAHVGNESIVMKELNFDGQPFTHYDVLGQGMQYRGYSNMYDRHGQILYGYSNPLRVLSAGSNVSSLGFKGGPPFSNPFGGVSAGSNNNFKGLRNVALQAGTSLDNIFGYIPRYSSYKFKLDQVHGEFRDELEFWHTFRNFYAMPILSHEFVNWELCADDNEFNRIFAVTTDSDNKFLCETHFTASVDRALPYVCVPQSK